MEPGQPANPASLPGRRRTHSLSPYKHRPSGSAHFPSRPTPARRSPTPRHDDCTTPRNTQAQPRRGTAGGRCHVHSRILSCQESCFFQPRSNFQFPPHEQLSWVADHCGSRPQPVTPSRGGGPAALFSVNRSAVRSHFRPYGACPLRECLVYTPFIYGALVCVS